MFSFKSQYGIPVGLSTPINRDEKMDLCSSNQASVHNYRGFGNDSHSTYTCQSSVTSYQSCCRRTEVNRTQANLAAFASSQHISGLSIR